jgi:uncharacterized repeat protein (TIGR01451 family)
MSRLLKGFMVFLIFSGFISHCHAFENSQLQWDNGTLNRLHRGDVAMYIGYSVEVVAFPQPVESEKYKSIPEEPVEPYVGLNISKKGCFNNTIILGLGESYIVPDGDLKVTAKELPSKNAKEWLFESYGPWAVIELNPRGIPVLEVSIETEDNAYISLSDTEIVATVTLKNKGSADAVGVDMSVDTELPIKRGKLKYHYDRVIKGEVIHETIAFSSPILTEKNSYSILANISGYDVKNVPYTAKFLKAISIEPEPVQIPSMRKSSNAKVYLKDYAMISLSLKNNGRYDLKNVSITDSVPDSFKLIGNNSLHWVVEVPSNGEWEFRYLIKPQDPSTNGIVLPAATAEFTIKEKFYRIQSSKPKIVVYGPKIVLQKQTDVSEIYPDDTVTVTIVAKNTGNTPSKTTIRDELPENAILVSGSTSKEDFLEANKEVRFSYSFKVVSKGSVKLPPATADYYELGSKDEKISVMSRELEIKVKSPPEIPPTPAKVLPVIDSSDNSADSGAVNGSVNRSDQPLSDEPVIDEPVSDEHPDGVNTIFYDLLGCNENSNGNFNDTHSACNFFRDNLEI